MDRQTCRLDLSYVFPYFDLCLLFFLYAFCYFPYSGLLDAFRRHLGSGSPHLTASLFGGTPSHVLGDGLHYVQL
jgi:hypothetical protein